ncbi:hypothetical protein J6590_075152 [Homalodisca vitripennis]|nr:hypothetical protein J6590_075152 [Homalodisca vitripennis]
MSDTMMTHFSYYADLVCVMNCVTDFKTRGSIREDGGEASDGMETEIPLVFDYLTIRRCRFSWEDIPLMDGHDDFVLQVSRRFMDDSSAFKEHQHVRSTSARHQCQLGATQGPKDNSNP